jgi:energy-coupling factor transporter ATP-binding protein EcfA2
VSNLTIPELALIVLIGPSGCGKSTFARKHFKATEVLSSDYCRGLVSDDENDQAATKDAFDVLHFIARNRLAAGKLTVVDATNVQPEARKPSVELAPPENLDRLRSRGLGAKRSLALREFALGIEALERFVRQEPLRRVHECVFGVLALDSEPVDPRL